MSDADARRFKALVEPHLDLLFRAAFRLTRHGADAEDLVQDTCVRAFTRIAELRQSEPVKAWLLRVLHNAFVDGARRAKRSPIDTGGDADELAAALASPHPSPEDSTYDAQREQRLYVAWLKLDRGHRALLALRAEGYSLTEITEITGLAADVLNARLYRARQTLARHLNEDAPLGASKEIAK